ncbi:MAG TPA: DUF4346 domain-containing protein [Thermoplasmata archaeon]|nr:DUF4346 domain-containing protein [Thermoplasmata archaeon]
MDEKDVVEIEATRNPKMVFDEKGFFVVFLRDGEIVAEHYQNVTHSSETVKTGTLDCIVVGKSALAMCHTIVREDLISRLEHAAYIGRELQKAEIAVRYGLDYVQDELLDIGRSRDR